MRVSSPIVPFFNGTLKSTRMNTRWPLSSRSLIESFAIGSRQTLRSALRRSHRGPREATETVVVQAFRPASQALLYQFAQQIDTAVRIAPFVVVPGQHFQEVAFHHLGVRHVD